MKKVVFFLAVALMSFAAKAQVTTFPWTEGFENGVPSSITLVDNDSDGYGWDNDTWGDSYAHTGSKLIASASYINNVGALTPDNWMILPAMTIPTGQSFSLSWYVRDYGYTENYGIFIGTTGTVAALSATTPVATYTTDGESYTKKSVDLSAYAGQTIYIAFRHYNVTDMYWLMIDDIRVGEAELPEVTLHGPSLAAIDASVTYTATSDVATLTWYVDGVQQANTDATFTYTFNALGTYTIVAAATNAAGTTSDTVVTEVTDGNVTSFPWIEDFESVSLNPTSNIGELPVGWSSYADNVSNYSQYAAFGQSWSVYDFGWQGKSAFCMTYTNSSTPCDRWMITPQLNIPATGDYKLKFDVYGSQYSEKLTVLVSTTGTAKADFTQTLMPQTVLNSGDATKLFDLSAYAGQPIYIAFKCTTTDGLYTVIDNVTVDELPANGLAYAGGMVQGHAPMGTDFDFYTAVENQGTAPMTSYTLTYTLNNGTAQTRTVTGINVAPYDYYIDTVTISYPTVGELTINLEMSAPNGQVDPDPSDNTGSLTVEIYDPASAAQRVSLLDHFTTAQCVNCPAAHERLHTAIVGYEDRIAWVAHHVGYYTDNMTLPADNQSSGVLGFYGSSTFAPGMMLDRDPEIVPGTNGGLVGSVSSAATIQSQFGNATSIPAFVTVELQNMSYDMDSRQVSFDVNGMFLSSVSGDVHLTVYITEDSIMASQSGASGMYQHDHVLRAVITDYWGDAISSTNAGDTYSKHYTYTLPSTWKNNKCRLIAFVNMHSSSFSNRQVLNATKSGFMTSTFGIEDVKPAISVKMWPNPVAEMAYIEAESTIRSYVVVNALGQRVMGAEGINAGALELNVSGLAAGVYFVSVTTDNGVSTERLSVVK